MIREIFGQIRHEYKRTAQNIQSLKRQQEEDPEKFKAYMKESQEEAEKAAAQAEEKKAEEAKASEEKAADEGAEG